MSDKESTTTAMEVEVLAPSSLGALERAAIDCQVATAHQYPRSLEQFKQRALSMATIDSETAESCNYCRPVGKEKDPETGKWVMKYAEGASIRLAEIVAASYGNLRVAARIVEQTPRYVKCEGVAHDLESNYAGKSEVIESTVDKEGNPYSDRTRILVAKATLAKAYRDAVFKVVPKALCKNIINQAKAVASKEGKTLAERRKAASAWLSSKKVEEGRVFQALGVKGWDDVSVAHLDTLSGLKTAIADGDTTWDEAFPPVIKESKLVEQEPDKSSGRKERQQQEARSREVASADGAAVAGSRPDPEKKDDLLEA